MPDTPRFQTPLFALHFTTPWWYFDAATVFIHTFMVFLVSVEIVYMFVIVDIT